MTPVTNDILEVACPACGLCFASAKAMKVHWGNKHGQELNVQLQEYTPKAEAISATTNAMNGDSQDVHVAPSPYSAPLSFDKSKHAICRLPVCAGCNKKFNSWQVLRRHVQLHD